MARQGQGVMDLFRAVRLSHVVDFFALKMVAANLWTSGWSFLHAPVAFYGAFGILVAAGGLGAAVAGLRLLRRREGVRAVDWPAPALCVIVWIAVCGGAYLHGLSAVASRGVDIYTPSHYAMPGFLPFLGFVLLAWRGFGRRWLWFAAAGALAALFAFTEWYGLFFVAAPYWTCSRDWHEIFARLSSVHPAFPSPRFLPALAAGYLCVLGALLKSAFTASQNAAD